MIMDLLVNTRTVTGVVPTSVQFGSSRDVLLMELSGNMKWSTSAADLVWCTGHTCSDTHSYPLVLAHGSSIAFGDVKAAHKETNG